jgi:hypothetical protein
MPHLDQRSELEQGPGRGQHRLDLYLGRLQPVE